MQEAYLRKQSVRTNNLEGIIVCSDISTHKWVKFSNAILQRCPAQSPLVFWLQCKNSPCSITPSIFYEVSLNTQNGKKEQFIEKRIRIIRCSIINTEYWYTHLRKYASILCTAGVITKVYFPNTNICTFFSKTLSKWNPLGIYPLPLDRICYVCQLLLNPTHRVIDGLISLSYTSFVFKNRGSIPYQVQC